MPGAEPIAAGACPARSRLPHRAATAAPVLPAGQRHCQTCLQREGLQSTASILTIYFFFFHFFPTPYLFSAVFHVEGSDLSRCARVVPIQLLRGGLWAPWGVTPSELQPVAKFPGFAEVLAALPFPPASIKRRDESSSRLCRRKSRSICSTSAELIQIYTALSPRTSPVSRSRWPLVGQCQNTSDLGRFPVSRH